MAQIAAVTWLFWQYIRMRANPESEDNPHGLLA